MRAKGKKSLSSLGRLSTRVKRHVVPDQGVSNELLDKFATSLCTSDFKGVFPSDTIPVAFAGRHNFILIVNLAPQRGAAVGHFVTIAASPSCVFYIDPFGLPCLDPNIARFLQHCRREVYFNRRQLQAMNSAYCGLYALLFACYLDRENWEGNRFRLKFKDKNLSANDRLCIKYLKKIVSE